MTINKTNHSMTFSSPIESDFKSFLRAVESGDVEKMSKFHDINRRDSIYGATALHLAAQVGNITSLNFLLSNGADHTILTNEGFSALHYAATNLEADAFDRLIAADAKLDDVALEIFNSIHDHLHIGDESIPSTFLENNGRSINAEKFFASRIKQLGS